MKSFYESFTVAVSCTAVTLLAASTLALAQDQSQPPQYGPEAQGQRQMASPGGGWPRADANAQGPYSAGSYQNGTADENQNQGDGPPPADGNGTYQNRPQYDQSRSPYAGQPQAPIPGQLTIAPGTYITVRVNQYLSSDKNQKGDAFSATLVQPVVVNGVVVAEPGETLGGQVVEAQKAGRVEGVARLGVQLTDLALVDGQQVPIQSQLISRKGDTSVGRDVGAIVGTTALGAAIGAGIQDGGGAAVGAGAGLLVSAIGVLVTRGHPSLIYPEQVLTFRIQAPVQISTANAPMAFRYVQPKEYESPNYGRGPETGPAYAMAAPPPPSPYYYGYPAYYGYGYGFGYPYYWGPSIGFYFGGRGYREHYYYGGGYRGGYYGGGYRGGGYRSGGLHASGGGHGRR